MSRKNNLVGYWNHKFSLVTRHSTKLALKIKNSERQTPSITVTFVEFNIQIYQNRTKLIRKIWNLGHIKVSISFFDVNFSLKMRSIINRGFFSVCLEAIIFFHHDSVLEGFFKTFKTGRRLDRWLQNLVDC